MNFEPSNCKAARNPESVPFESPPESVPEYPEVAKSIFDHRRDNACWKLVEKSRILSRRTVKLQEILKVYPGGSYRNRFRSIRKCPDSMLIRQETFVNSRALSSKFKDVLTNAWQHLGAKFVSSVVEVVSLFIKRIWQCFNQCKTYIWRIKIVASVVESIARFGYEK